MPHPDKKEARGKGGFATPDTAGNVKREMTQTASMDTSITVNLEDEAATKALAVRLAAACGPGDVILLQGGLGTGKTVFARAFIHARDLDGGGPGTEDVPSPTFTLVQTYDYAGGLIYHFDLYRLEDPEEIWELGLEEALDGGITLIEWPERLGSHRPQECLLVTLDLGTADSARRITFSGTGHWPERLKEQRLG